MRFSYGRRGNRNSQRSPPPSIPQHSVMGRHISCSNALECNEKSGRTSTISVVPGLTISPQPGALPIMR
jgi:hypothetical protein